MSFRIQLAAALFCSVAVIATDRSASAQSQQTSIVRNGAAPAPQNPTVEELPAGQLPAGQMGDGSQPHEYYPSGSSAPNGYYPGGGADGGCGDNCCQPSCGAPSGCSEPCCDSGGGCGSRGRFFFTADYLYVHSSFSEATAFIHQDLGAGTDYIVPLDFGYESSYRLGGGYRLCSCGEEIRFMFTRMTDDASAVAFPDDIVPFTAAPPPGGHTNIRANVDAKAYDLECAKTIPLGGQCGSCGDACGDGCGNGCGDACGKSCPAWDITWSGGVRWADVDWNRSYVALDDTDFPVTDVRSGMTFHGGGIRAGLEGRRYFFCDGWLSVYGKGNLSLLLGDVNIHTTRSSDDGNTVVSQTFVNRQLIPVTELEGGLTAQVTCHTAFTAGYLMTAWHDLGFRNALDVCDCGNTNPAPLLPAHFDDANILGFDGFFARIELAY